MGLLDQLTQSLSSALGGAEAGQNPLIAAAVQLLSQGSQGGGLAGLVEKFQNDGLGDVVNSWIGTGANSPISPDQLEQGLGSDVVQQLASKAGVGVDTAKTQLAGILPGLVDQLTPEGRLPQGGLLEEGLKLLAGKFGSA